MIYLPWIRLLFLSSHSFRFPTGLCLLTSMPRGVLKENLPEKVCVSCKRPFNWRKKWERCWDEVTTCSKSCNAKRRENIKLTRLDMAGYLPDGQEQEEIMTKAVEDVPTEEEGCASVESQLKITTKASNDDFDSNEDEDRAGKGGKESSVVEVPPSPAIGSREWRKAQRKTAKAQQRERREGFSADTNDVGRKSCDLCARKVDLLIRCTVDVSKQWRMVCGKCWHGVSGGVPDGDADHPHYTYGGLWKNRSRSVA